MALCASWVCARPDQEQGAAVSTLLRDLSLQPLVRSLQSHNTPTPGSPLPGTAVAPAPHPHLDPASPDPSRAVCHLQGTRSAHRTGRRGPAPERPLTADAQGPRPSRSGFAHHWAPGTSCRKDTLQTLGAADQNLPSGLGSYEPSAFPPVVTAPPRVTGGMGANRPPASPPRHRSPRLGTQGLRGRPPPSVEHRACLCAEAAAKYVLVSRARAPTGLGVATWRHLALSQERVNKRP